MKISHCASVAVRPISAQRATTLHAGQSITFTLRLNAATAGSFSGDISFANSDANEGTYDLHLQGTVTAGSTSGGVTSKVNANSASQAELEAAFTAAGIPNAAKWAKEVTEYRPYPVDPTWAQLRQELSKYNISQAVFAQIIAVLEV